LGYPIKCYIIRYCNENHWVWHSWSQHPVIYTSRRYGERDMQSRHVPNFLSLHYRTSTRHLIENISKPSNIFYKLQ
jgi:hypothetical protein